MSNTPYTDKIVNRICNSTIDSNTLAFNINSAIDNAIVKTVSQVARRIIGEELEEYGAEVNLELRIDEFDPKAAMNRILDKVIQMAALEVKRDLDINPKITLSLDESSNQTGSKNMDKLQVLCD